MIGSLKKSVFGAAAVCLGLFAAVFLAEGFLRVLGPGWLKERMKEVGVPTMTDADPAGFGSDKDWPILRRNGRFIKYEPLKKMRVQHYEYDLEAATDKWGGRASFHSGEFSDRLIPFLGDSFIFGVGVKDQEVFVSLLAQDLKKPLINLGVPGSCLSNHLDLIEERHKELNTPNVYVLGFFLGNDLTNLYDYPSRKPRDNNASNLEPLKNAKSTQALQGINDFIRHSPVLRRMYLIQFVKSKLLILYNDRRAKKGVIRRMDDDLFHVIQPSQHLDEMTALLKEEIVRARAIAKRLRFKPIFILIPDRHQVYPARWEAKLRYYGLKPQEVDAELPNRILSQELSAQGFFYIDPLECLRQKAKESKEPLYYTLDNHLTKTGHRCLAECVGGAMKGLLGN